MNLRLLLLPLCQGWIWLNRGTVLPVVAIPEMIVRVPGHLGPVSPVPPGGL